MDLTASIEPKSDQLDAVDLIGGPRTFTIKSVAAHNSEQPVNIHLVESDRPWRPSKSMRRVLVAAWGVDGKAYEGRRLTLYCDPDVEFGGIKVGGSRISHMSHIDKPLAVALLIKRGKSAVFTVQPLKDAPPVQAAALDRLTPTQKSGIGAQIKRTGISKDDYLALATEASGRIVGGTDELTESEAAKVLESLAQIASPIEIQESSGLTAAKAALHGEQGALA